MWQCWDLDVQNIDRYMLLCSDWNPAMDLQVHLGCSRLAVAWL
jgi:hypothetical protein